MKKKSLLSVLTAICSVASIHASSRGNPLLIPDEKSLVSTRSVHLTTYTYDLDPLIVVSQNVNEKGLVVMSGQFNKPFTNSNILLSVKYQNAQGEWVTGWCKTLYSYNQYNEILKATFELPASANPTYNLKVELSSDTSTSNFSSVVWGKAVSHYKQSDYSAANCDLDENEYTILLTPKKESTLITDANGKVTGIKDRVTSAYSWNKLGNVIMNNKKNNVVFSPKNPATLLSNKSIKMLNQGAVSDTLASTPEIIYDAVAGHPVPYLYTYNDPVYMVAGKFSINGLLMKFSQWPGDTNGPGYHDFRNPNLLKSRYFNLYNTMYEKLSDFMQDQEPIVIVSSQATGLRIYKSNGTYISFSNLTGTSNYGAVFFGYGNDQGGTRRGPGSENLIISNTPEMTFYGMGALRNDATTTSQSVRSISDIESEIAKFTNYVGVFDTVKLNTGECSNSCFEINSGAQPSLVTDWTKAPNSYIFTGKDKNGNNADGLYIPVKKAYEMWARGGDFMKDDNGNYTNIPEGPATAGLYWEDEPGLIKSVTLEGTGENAKIKVLINKVKEGNASISYKVNGQIYWTWHVWVTDDPTTDGSNYHHGFEKDKDGNLVTDWKWMDRNLGATNANFVGNDWHKSAGLQYQWGRKDPFPTFVYKDSNYYSISGEVNLNPKATDFTSNFVRLRGNSSHYPTQPKTGTDTPNGNIRYSIKNPIHYILPPIYIAPTGQTLANEGENYLQQTSGGWIRRDITTWFSKQKYKQLTAPYSRENIVAWDLWGDIRQGKYSDIDDDTNLSVANQSTQYALKSPYDPCPCNWRVPSYYFSGGRNSGTPLENENRYSPWGKHTGTMTENDKEIKFNVLNALFPGIKITPQLGFDFTGVTDMNLGKFPINGNYETYPNLTGPTRNGTGWVMSQVVYQDQSADGGLHSSTFTTASANGVPLYGSVGPGFIADPFGTTHTAVGWYHFEDRGSYGDAYESSGVRCIKDPNNAYMPTEFETVFVEETSNIYSLETLKEWSKLANSHIRMTNTANADDRVINIPLRKAYAMQKLYLRSDGSLPSGGTKSASVVWTSNNLLINKIQIIDSPSIEDAYLQVTLNSGRTGNAVVAFHLGNGNMQDPILWSWHIWAPETNPEENTPYTTESLANGGVYTTTDQIVDPVKSKAGVPMTTIFMDRDLGSLLAFPTLGSVSTLSATDQNTIYKSAGLHYQWGRKDALPRFTNPGGLGAVVVVYKQTGVNASNDPVYSTVNETQFVALSKDYPTYKTSAGVDDIIDSKGTKVNKILKYSTENPLAFLYQVKTPAPIEADPSGYNAATDAVKSSKNNTYRKDDLEKRPKDWLSDEVGFMKDRWGHATSKSPFDPCPDGWRIPDNFFVASGSMNSPTIIWDKGNSPWFYNRYQNGTSYLNYGFEQSGIINLTGKGKYGGISNVNNAINVKEYPGNVVAPVVSGTRTLGNVFNFDTSQYKIGNYANSGYRGLYGGNGNTDPTILYLETAATTYVTGIWTAAPTEINLALRLNLGSSVGSTDARTQLTTGTATHPQTAMSCRCSKIQYDANGKEVPRYDPNAIPVSTDTTGPGATLTSQDVNDMVKNKLVVFPNPVKDLLNLDAKDDKDYYYQIYNMAGQLIKKGKFNNKQTDISDLSTGNYLVRINNSESVVKIIKQ